LVNTRKGHFMSRQRWTVDDIRGVVALPPTPANDDASSVSARDTVNVGESERMIRHLFEDGIDGICTNGTLGEMATLTLAEWKTFASTVVETAQSLNPDLPLFIGVTTLNTRETVERARFVHDLGGRGIFVGRPFWSQLGLAPMLQFYRDLAEAVPDMSIVLYDNPEAFKGPIPTPLYHQLTEIPQVVAVKYIAMTPKLGGDMKSVNGKIRILPIEFDWLAARTLFPEAAVGCWSSSAMCDPTPVLALRDALDKGDVETARELHRRILHTYETFIAVRDFPEFSKYNIPLEKIRFDEAGYVKAGPVRSPYHVVPEEYAEGARESGRRWRALAQELRAAGSSN
jgi:dihydrodipicolinate synthase/N-acetylneuraminate lyase